MAKFAKDREIVVYCDLHGHSRKHDVFIYGCNNTWVSFFCACVGHIKTAFFLVVYSFVFTFFSLLTTTKTAGSHIGCSWNVFSRKWCRWMGLKSFHTSSEEIVPFFFDLIEGYFIWLFCFVLFCFEKHWNFENINSVQDSMCIDQKNRRDALQHGESWSVERISFLFFFFPPHLVLSSSYQFSNLFPFFIESDQFVHHGGNFLRLHIRSSEGISIFLW